MGICGMAIADDEGAFDRGVIVIHDASSSENAQRARRQGGALARFQTKTGTSAQRDE